MTDLEKLKRAYDAFNTRLRESGVSLLRYHAPCCGAILETQAAAPGETWNTFATCPKCGRVHKVTNTENAVVAALAGEEPKSDVAVRLCEALQLGLDALNTLDYRPTPDNRAFVVAARAALLAAGVKPRG